MRENQMKDKTVITKRKNKLLLAAEEEAVISHLQSDTKQLHRSS